MARKTRHTQKRKAHSKRESSRKSNSSTDGSVALLIVLGFLVWFFFIRSNAPEIAEDYSVQIEALDDSERVLIELAAFLSQQRNTLQEQEEYLDQLGEEADGLRLFLDTERPKVQAILDAQAREYQKDRWIELIASFVVGIIASLAAQLIYRRFLESRGREESPDVAP